MVVGDILAAAKESASNGTSGCHQQCRLPLSPIDPPFTRLRRPFASNGGSVDAIFRTRRRSRFTANSAVRASSSPALPRAAAAALPHEKATISCFHKTASICFSMNHSGGIPCRGCGPHLSTPTPSSPHSHHSCARSTRTDVHFLALHATRVEQVSGPVGVPSRLLQETHRLLLAGLVWRMVGE